MYIYEVVAGFSVDPDINILLQSSVNQDIERLWLEYNQAVVPEQVLSGTLDHRDKYSSFVIWLCQNKGFSVFTPIKVRLD